MTTSSKCESSKEEKSPRLTEELTVSTACESSKEKVPLRLTEELKASLSRSVRLLALKVPVTALSAVKPLLKDLVWKCRGQKSVVASDSSSHRLVVLKQGVSALECSLWAALRKLGASSVFVQRTVGYASLSAKQALGRWLGAAVPVPVAYTTVGHLAQLNLREEHYAFRHLIGAVFLDKSPPCVSVVVCKSGQLDAANVFRICPLEVLASRCQAPNPFWTRLRENGCVLEFDFSKVYFNSRLSTEHWRITECTAPQSTVCDLTAGIGPFVLPLAKSKRCRVFANDLNPAAFDALKHNAARNKVAHLLTALNADGRNAWLSQTVKAAGEVHAVVCNLPAVGLRCIEWLKASRTEAHLRQFGSPLLHCYCFAQSALAVRCELLKVLGADECECEVRKVRNVSPKNDMFCVSLHLPLEYMRVHETADDSTDATSTLSVATQSVAERSGDTLPKAAKRKRAQATETDTAVCDPKTEPSAKRCKAHTKSGNDDSVN